LKTRLHNIRNIRFRQQPYNWCCVPRHIGGISHTDFEKGDLMTGCSRKTERKFSA